MVVPTSAAAAAAQWSALASRHYCDTPRATATTPTARTPKTASKARWRLLRDDDDDDGAPRPRRPTSAAWSAASPSSAAPRPPSASAVRAWLADVCGGGAASFCGGQVRTCAKSWPLYATPLPAPLSAATLVVATRRPLRDLAFAGEELAPLLAATAALLQEASGGARRASDVATFVYVARGGRRALPADPGEPIAAPHVNGGLTTRGGWSLVFLREDAAKVAVHELLHAMGCFDDVLFGQPASLALAKHARVTSVGSPVSTARSLLSEAATETLATWLHAQWWLARRGLLQRRSAPAAAVEARLARHIDVVAGRVVRHCRRRGGSLGTATWVEATNAYAYYVCKAAAWRRLPQFLAGVSRWGLLSAASRGGSDDAAAAAAAADFARFLGQAGGPLERLESEVVAAASRRRGRGLRMTCL
jgi:hypothetical protein